MSEQHVSDLVLRRDISLKTSIACIPPEILVSIFIIVKTMDEIENWREKHLEWIKVTHVCRLWREVGIRAQCLWTNIPAFSEEWTNEMLKRSNGNPVTVSYDFNKSGAMWPDIPASQSILRHFSHIEELNVHGTTNLTLREFINPTTFSERLLQLHTLRISGFLKGFDVVVISNKTLPPGMASLRRLSLSNCTLDWDNSQFLFSLTHLRITGNVSDPFLQDGVERLLEILRKMPSLESLDLEFFTDPNIEGPKVNQLPSDYQKIYLPSLKILRLGVHMDQLEVILAGMELSSDVSLKLYCYHRNGSISSLPRILSACATHLHCTNNSNDQPSIQSLEWSNYSQHECRVRLWPNALSQDELNTVNKPPRMETVFSWDKTVELTADIAFQNLFQAFNLENLVSLSIYDVNPVDCRTWATTFGTLPRLETIDLGNTRSRGLLQALVLEADGEGIAKESIPFQTLRSLSLSLAEVLFKDSSRTTQHLILQTLTKRSRVGLGLRQLIIRDTDGLSRKIMDHIRKVVPDVQKVRTPAKTPTDPIREAYTFNAPDLDEIDALMSVWG